MRTNLPTRRSLRTCAPRVVALACVALVATTLGACAVLESDPNPPPLFVDSGSSHSSAEAGQDAGEDATIDAHGEAGHDAGLDVTVGSDARPDVVLDAPKSIDAGPDAHGPDSEVHEAGVSDAPIHDAKSEADQVADAAKRGYCASAFAELAPLTFAACDDFDEDAGTYGIPTVNNPPTTTFTFESTVFNSPPKAMLVTTQPPDGSIATSEVQFAVPVSSISYVLQYDLRVDAYAVPASSSTVVSAINFQNGIYNEDIAIGLQGGGDAGPLTIGVEEVEPADGGKASYKAHPTFPFPSTGGWTHVTLKLVASTTGGPWSYSLSLNNTPVDSNELLDVFVPAGYGYASVGLDYSMGKGVRELYVDNVLVEVQ